MNLNFAIGKDNQLSERTININERIKSNKMKPHHYATCSKESTSNKTIEMIMRETRDLNAMIKANLCYLSDAQKASLMQDIKETLNLQ